VRAARHRGPSSNGRTPDFGFNGPRAGPLFHEAGRGLNGAQQCLTVGRARDNLRDKKRAPGDADGGLFSLLSCSQRCTISGLGQHAFSKIKALLQICDLRGLI
jgi:hypothetical protein